MISEKDYNESLRIMAMILLGLMTNGNSVIKEINETIEDEHTRYLLKKNIATALLTAKFKSILN